MNQRAISLAAAIKEFYRTKGVMPDTIQMHPLFEQGLRWDEPGWDVYETPNTFTKTFMGMVIERDDEVHAYRLCQSEAT